MPARWHLSALPAQGSAKLHRQVRELDREIEFEEKAGDLARADVAREILGTETPKVVISDRLKS